MGRVGAEIVPPSGQGVADIRQPDHAHGWPIEADRVGSAHVLMRG